MNAIKLNFMNLNNERVRYVPVAANAQMVAMDETTGIRVESRLIQLGSDRTKTMDRWSVVVSLDGVANRAFQTEVSFGTGHRAKINDSMQNLFNVEPTVPVEPTAAKVVSILAREVESAINMPRGKAAAVRYVQSELGCEDAGKAFRIADALTEIHDGMASLLGNARLQDFVDFGRELEDVPEPDFKNINLPEVTIDGNRFKAVIDVSVTRIAKGTRDIDGNVIGSETALSASFTGTILSKEDRPHARWSGVTSGQCKDKIAEMWGDHPEVRELLKLWDDWHLSHMHAGSRLQTEFLDGVSDKSMAFHDMLKALKDAGLEIDTQIEGSPYRYGTAWLANPVPSDVVERISDLRELIPSSKPDAAAAAPKP